MQQNGQHPIRPQGLAMRQNGWGPVWRGEGTIGNEEAAILRNGGKPFCEMERAKLLNGSLN
jgi:hypothetical protein